MDRSKRGKRGAKRLDLAVLREALKDGKVWSGLGVVTLFQGETSHFEIIAEEGVNVDILVDVELMPNREKVACRLGQGGGGGVWKIPAVGVEVAVLIPQGDLGADPIIVATLDSPPASVTTTEIVVIDAPNVTINATGTALNVTATDANATVAVSSGGNVNIFAGGDVRIGEHENDTFEPLVKRSEFLNHTHTLPGMSAGANPVAADPVQLSPGSVAAPANIAGTATLKGA